MANQKNQQTWGNCAYAVGAGVKNCLMLIMLPSSQGLSETHFFEVYACENKKIRELGVYPINYIEMHHMPDKYNPQQVAVLCHLEDYDKRFTEDDKKRLRSEVERGITACRNCMFHEPRKHELHPKSEVERVKELTQSLQITA